MNETDAINNKLNRIVLLLEGDGKDIPGVIQRVNALNELLLGKGGIDGVVQKVNSMWKIHIWILCTASAGMGYALKSFVEQITR